MIRKIPNLNAWILRFKDIQTLLRTNKGINNGGLIELPLFSNISVVIPIRFYWQFDCTLIDNDQDRIVLVVDRIINCLIDFTLDEIDVINKIWNELYVSENKL